jgi:hypothetical protein
MIDPKAKARGELRAPSSAERDLPDEAPGVPGFRTWRGVYAFVLGAFVLIVLALAIFSHVFA